MQAARNLVSPLAELAAGVEVGQHQLERGNLVHRMQIDRDAAAVVLDRARAVEVNADRDLGGKAARASSMELSTTSKTQW